MSADLSRRGFLAGLAGSLAWASDLEALARRVDATRPQEFWSMVRDAFVVPHHRIYLNVGTLGAQPRVVIDAVVEHTRRVAETYPPAAPWDLLKAELGELLGGDAAGFVFPRNTTEAMNFVANGLDFTAGDEILTTDHEHIGGLCCWQLAAARQGLRLRVLPLPSANAGTEAIVDTFRRAVSARTRVISFSHVNFTNGLVMPAREIVRLCRERDIIAVVDGAHPPGLIPVDLADLDPDFYTSSPHKWLLAPQGTGLLWMREPWRTRLWPTIASGGWDDRSLGAHRFNHLGTLDESRLFGLLAALQFHRTIGSDRVMQRIRQLRDRLVDGLTDVRGLSLTSPAIPDAAAGMVSFRIAGRDMLELQRRLSDTEAPPGTPDASRRLQIRTRVIGEYDYNWMRLAPHIYNDETEIDTAVAALAAAVA